MTVHGAPCACVKTHLPPVAYTQLHHIVPLSWGGPDDGANRIPLCGTSHDAIHDLLNKIVRAGKRNVPQKGYSRYVRELANRAIGAYVRDHDGQMPPAHMLTMPHQG